MNIQYVCDLILRQNGRGYYSGLPFQLHRGDFQLSLERLDNTIGYTQNNVVAEAHEFNTSDSSSRATIESNVSGSGQWNRDKIHLWYTTRFKCDLHKQMPNYHQWLSLA